MKDWMDGDPITQFLFYPDQNNVECGYNIANGRERRRLWQKIVALISGRKKNL